MVYDQAQGLRELDLPDGRSHTKTGRQQPMIVTVTSGKGGVGKSNSCVNLAVALAKQNQRVAVMDADLSLANIDVLLGLSPQQNLSHVLNGQAKLTEILLPAAGGIRVIPASSGIKRMAQLQPQETLPLIHQLSQLNAYVDYLLIDTAAGIADSVIRFCLASHGVVVVVVDEPTSITDAYALIKLMVTEYGIKNVHVLANQVSDAGHGEDLFHKMSQVCEQFIGFKPHYFGSVPTDPKLKMAVKRQRSIVEWEPQSPASRAYIQLAGKLLNWPTNKLHSNNALHDFGQRVFGA